MKAPTSLFDRPGRATAVVGAVIAVSATAAVALLSGTATATPDAGQAGKCTKNVNVRAEPDTGSRIVALCEAGTAVQVGESRDGFLRLTNLGGWASQEYISVNGRAPASAGRATTSGDDTEDADDRRAGRGTDDARAGRHGRHGAQSSHGSQGTTHSPGTHSPDAEESSTDDSADSTDPTETDESEDEAPAQRPAPSPAGGLGGLLG
jgi:SH3 domain-containing protein